MVLRFCIHSAEQSIAFQVTGGARRRRNIDMQGRPGRDSGADVARTARHPAVIGNVARRLCPQCTRPGRRGRVAAIAVVGSCDVACVFAYCLDAVMARRA